MTTCIDGPAQGQNFQINRSPIYMRVTEELGKWDCLNDEGDRPKPTETLYVYRMKEFKGRAHLNFGRKGGAWVTICDYELVVPQPDDKTLRNQADWVRWAESQEHYIPKGWQ